MKRNKWILSAVVASMALAGCSSHAPKEYVVVDEGCCGPVAAAPMMMHAPVMHPPVQINACCDAPAPEAVVPPKPAIEQKVVHEHHVMESPVKQKKSELLKITGIGYGAESTYQAYTPGQRRLMAIRSSKLDAYRALAEQIYGIKIDSNTSVATLTAKSDSFRARVNAVVRGARVVSVTPMADNNYETVLEVYVDKAFFEKAFVYTADDDEVALDPDDMYRFRTVR